MRNIELIRENFARMPNEQLTAIAEKEGHELMPEAFQILKEEFRKRGLSYSTIQSVEEKKAEKQQQKMELLTQTDADKNAVWKYIFDQKEKEAPNREIIKGLEELGLDESNAILLLSNLAYKLKEEIARHHQKVVFASASFLIGLLVTIITYTIAQSSDGTYIVAWGAILFGGIRFFTGISDKEKCVRLLEKIEQEEVNQHSQNNNI